MNVLLLSQWLLAALLLEAPGDVAGQFTAAPPTCPGDIFTFRCTVTGDRNGITIWRVGGSSECTLAHSTAGASSTCGAGSAFTAIPGAEFGTSATFYSSTLSGIATSELNGTLVECFGPDLNRTAENRVGKSTFWILGPPSVPTLSCVDLSEDISGAVNVTVNWTLSGRDSADFYLISITTNAPQTPYEGLLNITNASVTQHELTGFMAVYKYNITVHGVNCESQEGRESETLIIKPQVPAVLNSCNIISLLYNQLSGRLLFIDMNWDSMPNQIDQGEACPSPRGDITQYQINFQTASSMVTVNVSSARCTAGRCSHTFEPPSNPSSSYDSVSVAAENVVGVGAPSMCTTQPINMNNNLLAREVLDVSSPSDATINCTFLSGFTGAARCTVQYGTDPTYMNLPYSAESTETGTAGDTVSVVLRERLNSSTVYYYTVSAVSGDVTVRVRGNFTTPQYSCSPMELWNLPAVGATFLSDVSILNDVARYPSCDAGSVGSAVLMNTTLDTATVAYYTRTTPGSRACFVCDKDSGYELTNNERICQSNSTWSGSPILCVCTLSRRLLNWHYPLIVIGALFLAFGVVVGMILITIIYKKYHEKWKNLLWISVIGIILFVIGVALWTAVGVVVSNPPNENVCDPSWHLSRDGLIVSGLIVSSLVPIVLPLVLSAAYYWYFHQKKQCRGLPEVSSNFVAPAEESSCDDDEVQLIQEFPLHKAAEKGDLDKVKDLVENGADINIKDNNWRTPLYVAVERGHVDIVKYLVDDEADIEKNEDGRTPLYMAAGRGHTEIVKYFIDREEANVNTTDKTRVTPLHMAAEGGHIDTVKYLVGKGAHINAKDNDRITPLHLAAKQGHIDSVKYLVDKRADVGINDNNGYTPIYVAAEGDHMDILDYLITEEADINIKDDAGMTPLYVAVVGGHLNRVKHLVEKGADTNTTDWNGGAPLHVAAERDHMDIVKFLVGKGALIDIKDKEGRTPLHIAAKEGHTNIVKTLVDKGAKIDIKDNAGRAPLHTAVTEGKELAVKALVNNRANINIKDMKGMTPLHVVAERGGISRIVEFLVNKGSDLNMKDDDERTPLHIAAREGQELTVECLVRNGADVSIKNKKGMTPLHVAAERGGRFHIMKCLIEKGADVNIKDNDGRTPLHLASREGHNDTVEYLVKKGANTNKDKNGTYAEVGPEPVTPTSDGNEQHEANDQPGAPCLSESRNLQQSDSDAPAKTNQKDIALQACSPKEGTAELHN